MAESTERGNFAKLFKVFTGPIPVYLRTIFLREWNRMFPSQPWESGQASGNQLWHKIPVEVLSIPTVQSIHDKIVYGQEETWNTTILMIILLYSGVGLIPECRRKAHKTTTPLSISDEIDMLRELRWSFYNRAQNMSWPVNAFSEFIENIKFLTNSMDNTDVKEEIDRILRLPIDLTVMRGLFLPMDNEFKSAKELNTLIDEVRKRKDVKALTNSVSEVKDEDKRVTDEEVRDNVEKVQLAVRDVRRYSMPIRSEACDVRQDSSKVTDVDGQICHMEPSVEDMNLAKLSKIIVNVVPFNLRELFIAKWDKEFPNKVWKSDQESCSQLLNKIPHAIKSNEKFQAFFNKDLHEKDTAWDTSTLIFLLLYSGVNLIPKVHTTSTRTHVEDQSRHCQIDKIRELREIFFSSHSRTSISIDDFNKVVAEIKSSAKEVFGNEAVAGIEEIVSSIITLKEKTALDMQLDRERRRVNELKELIRSIEVHDSDSDGTMSLEDNDYKETQLLARMEYGDGGVKTDLISSRSRCNEITNGLYGKLCASEVEQGVMNDHKKGAKYGDEMVVGCYKIIDHIEKYKKKVKKYGEEFNDVLTNFAAPTFHDVLQKLLDSHSKLTRRRSDLRYVDGSEEQSNTVMSSPSLMPEVLENQHHTHRGIVGSGTTVNIGSGGYAAVGDGATVQNIYYPARETCMHCCSDKLKKEYREECQKHKIYCINEADELSVQEVNMSDFAVNLQLCSAVHSEGTLREEAQYQYCKRNYFHEDHVEISELIDHDNRVTFIRGIAGMGKSVLSKQLVCGWANDEIYKDFKVCVMFECRELNHFVETRGAVSEAVSEFVKKKVNCDLGKGDGVLFVIDGLDVLLDLQEGSSVIMQLIDQKISKFSMSKFIITGRPQSEKVFERRDIETGGLRILEIKGVDDHQINTYIGKFCSKEHHKTFLDKLERSSKSCPLLYIPQSLNVVCCFTILTQGKFMNDGATLYCWVVYYLLKQHAEKSSSERLTISQIFKKYSEALIFLGRVCHELLINNDSTHYTKMESLLGVDENVKAFIESLFVDVSDERQNKCQFKYLPLMEFFCALYICGVSNRIEVLKNILKNGWIRTVSFVSRLIAGVSSEDIVGQTLSNVTNITSLDSKQFLSEVLNLLSNCSLDDITKLKKSLEVTVFFLNEHFDDKSLLFSVLSKFQNKAFESNVIDSKNIFDICNHLVTVCKCNEEEIQKELETATFDWFDVDDVEILSCSKYFKDLNCVVVCNCRLDFHVLCKTLGTELSACREVVIANCEDRDENKRPNRKEEYSCGFDRLLISHCSLVMNSFEKLCKLLTSSKKFQMSHLEINEQGWETLVNLIKRNKSFHGFRLKSLEINKCGTTMGADMQKEITKLGIDLKIDGVQVEDDQGKPRQNRQKAEPLWRRCPLI